MVKKTEKIETVREVQAMLAAGLSKRKIAKALHISRNTVDKYVAGNPEYLAQPDSKAFSGILVYQSDIISLIQQGYNKKSICQYITGLGYTGKLTQFYEFCRVLREEGLVTEPAQLQKGELIDPILKKKYHYVTRNQVFQYIWSNKRDICEEDWETIIKRFPFLETLQTCVHDFREMFVNKQQADLDEFLACYSNCGYELLQRFCTGLQKDYASVSLAVTSPYSNGFVEGTNNKLKMIKRTAYGRCSLNLLKSKMLLSSALI